VTRPLRIGIQLPEVERDVRWPEYLAMAQQAEAVGFDSLWLGDHLLYRNDGHPARAPWEAWTLLAAIAAVPERVALGPLVACVAFHPPAVLAKMASTVDEISNGRLVLGLGAGWNKPEFDGFGLPFDHRASRFAEALPIIVDLVNGKRSTSTGTYSRTDDAVLLPASKRRADRPLPLMIGSEGDRVLELSLPHVHMWNTWFSWFGNTPEGFATLNDKVSAIAERVGRAPGEIERSACVMVLVDPSSTERPAVGDAPPLAGTPEQIANELRLFAEAGADEVILVVNPINEASIAYLAEALAELDR